MENNTTSVEVVLSLIAGSLFDKEIKLPDDVNWDEVLKLLFEQGVNLIPFKYLKNLDFDEKIKSKYIQKSMYNVFCYVICKDRERKLFSLLKENSIPSAVIKGSSISKYYPLPEQRLTGDIDFIVSSSKFDDAQKLLSDNGYGKPISNGVGKRHVAFKSYRAEYEMHRYFSVFENKEKVEKFEDIIQRQLKDCKYENGVSYLDDMTNGLIMLHHINIHMSSGIGLRQMCDFAVFCSRFLDDITFKEQFEKLCIEFDLLQLAKVCARFSQKYLGLQTENISWCSDIDDDLCKNLLEYILKNGNLGHNNKKASDKIALTYGYIGDKRSVFKICYISGVCHWKTAQKYKVLRPFAFFYGAFRYLFLLIRSGNIKENLKRADENAKYVNDLMDRIGAYNTWHTHTEPEYYITEE